jgi:hypothetical protein
LHGSRKLGNGNAQLRAIVIYSHSGSRVSWTADEDSVIVAVGYNMGTYDSISRGPELFNNSSDYASPTDVILKPPADQSVAARYLGYCSQLSFQLLAGQTIYLNPVTGLADISAILYLVSAEPQ